METLKMPSTTYSNVANVSYARLENGSCKYETRGTIDYYSYYRVTLLIPKGDGNISIEDGHQFLNIVKMKYLEAGCRINESSNLGLLNCKSPFPTSSPQHRILLDSRTFDECGSFKPLVTSVGMETDLPSSLQKELFLLDTNYTKSYEFWLNDASRVKMQLIVRWEIYDLCATPFSQQKQTRSWVSERTITRRMAKTLEQLTGQSKVRYKGVRWRPERKHPWVAEMKLPKRKKMWIGNFDTPEEAAQAYIEAAMCYQKQKTIESQGASHERGSCVEPKTQSPITSFEHRAQDTSTNISSSPFHLQRDDFEDPNFLSLGALSTHHATSNVDHDRGIDQLLDVNSEASFSDDSCELLFEPHGLAGPKDILSAFICNTRSNINAAIEPPYMFAKDLPDMVDHSFAVDRLSTSFQSIVNYPDPFELVS